MSKFKKGDKVKVLEKKLFSKSGNYGFYGKDAIGITGYISEITSLGSTPYCVKNEKNIYVGMFGGSEIELRASSEILTQETYTKIHPKVGDKFRVKKDLLGCTSKTSWEIPKDTVTITKVYVDGDFNIENHHWTFAAECMTAQYLEPIQTINQTNKQSIMQQLTSALKRALSSDKQALYRTRIIGSDLELTSTGRAQYINALFNNEGDHKKATSEMVDNAKEEIEEAKG